jgi:hypothetical protein
MTAMGTPVMRPYLRPVLSRVRGHMHMLGHTIRRATVAAHMGGVAVNILLVAPINNRMLPVVANIMLLVTVANIMVDLLRLSGARPRDPNGRLGQHPRRLLWWIDDRNGIRVGCAHAVRRATGS